jgi:hypothetical protein
LYRAIGELSTERPMVGTDFLIGPLVLREARSVLFPTLSMPARRILRGGEKDILVSVRAERTDWRKDMLIRNVM